MKSRVKNPANPEIPFPKLMKASREVIVLMIANNEGVVVSDPNNINGGGRTLR